jgi:hypothetical protein
MNCDCDAFSFLFVVNMGNGKVIVFICLEKLGLSCDES